MGDSNPRPADYTADAEPIRSNLGIAQQTEPHTEKESLFAELDAEEYNELFGLKEEDSDLPHLQPMSEEELLSLPEYSGEN